MDVTTDVDVNHGSLKMIVTCTGGCGTHACLEPRPELIIPYLAEALQSAKAQHVMGLAHIPLHTKAVGCMDKILSLPSDQALYLCCDSLLSW